MRTTVCVVSFKVVKVSLKHRDNTSLSHKVSSRLVARVRREETRWCTSSGGAQSSRRGATAVGRKREESCRSGRERVEQQRRGRGSEREIVSTFPIIDFGV
jgi:hypothetical protein